MNKTIEYGSLDAAQRLAFCRGELPSASAFKDLETERQALAFLLKRFVDGEHNQDENQAERHMYHDEAEALLAYLGGEVQGHTLVPDEILRTEHEKKKALVAENERLTEEYDKAWRHDLNDKKNYQVLAEEVARLHPNAELFCWLSTQCGEEFKVDLTGIKADGEEVRWALGYEGETDLRQAVRSAMIEDGQVATPSTDNENVSRHEGGQA